MTDAVIAENLIKTYSGPKKSRVKALDGLDLSVPEGSVLALLGPNGAGKTTCVRVLATLLRPDSGRAEVAGVDVLKHPNRVRELIGLSGQYAAVDEYLTGFENLDMVGQLYHLGRATSRERARELLTQFRLDDAADRPVKTYSGGMRRRLDLAGALVARPKVLFLDEPTTGLDPRSRTEMWQVLADLVADGASLLITTQYLEEADRLADNIVVVDHGKVIARGTSDELKSQVGGEVVEVVVTQPDQLLLATKILAEVAHGVPVLDQHTRKVTVSVTGGDPAATVLVEALRALDAAGIGVLDVAVRRPTLDDVFLSLTGHSTDEAAESDSAESDDLSGPRKGRARRQEAAR